jgi:hypothetical protein
MKVNDKVIAEYVWPTAYSEDLGYPTDRRFYFKMGLYRDDIAQPMAIFFDEYYKLRITDSQRQPEKIR